MNIVIYVTMCFMLQWLAHHAPRIMEVVTVFVWGSRTALAPLPRSTGHASVLTSSQAYTRIHMELTVKSVTVALMRRLSTARVSPRMVSHACLDIVDIILFTLWLQGYKVTRLFIFI